MRTVAVYSPSWTGVVVSLLLLSACVAATTTTTTAASTTTSAPTTTTAAATTTTTAAATTSTSAGTTTTAAATTTTTAAATTTTTAAATTSTSAATTTTAAATTTTTAAATTSTSAGTTTTAAATTTTTAAAATTSTSAATTTTAAATTTTTAAAATTSTSAATTTTAAATTTTTAAATTTTTVAPTTTTTVAPTTTTPAPTTAPVVWTVFSVAESTQTRSMPNTLTFTMQPSITLNQGQIITIAGMTGTQTTGTTIAISGANAGNFNSPATWNQATGTMVFSIASGNSLASTGAVAISITVINPIVQQNAPTITISTNGVQVATATQPNPAVLQATSTQAGTWTTSTNMESNTVQGLSDTLSFTFQPSLPIPATGTITIAGLTGTQTSATALALSGSGASLFVGSAGLWTQNTGTLVLTAAATISASTTTTISITVTNSASTQTAVTPTITAGGIQVINQANFGTAVLGAASPNPCLPNGGLGNCVRGCSLSPSGSAICAPCGPGYTGDGTTNGSGCQTVFSFSLAATPQTFNLTAFQCNVAKIINQAGGGPVQCSDIMIQGQPIFS